MNNPRRIQRHLAKALAAGAVLVAAALPMAIAGVASAAATTYTVAFSTSTHAYTGPGDSGTVTITASAPTFAGDGGNATITTNATGVTFSGVVDTSTTVLTASYAVASTTTPGAYNLTITDNAGTETIASGFTVNAAPTVTSLSPTSIVDNPAATATPVTVTGSGFFGTPTVTLTNSTNGTMLKNTVTASAVYPATASTLTVNVTPVNKITNGAATPGTYTMTVTNPDGGTVTTGAIFTITGDEVSNVTPSSFNAVSTAYAITINGGGFQQNAAVYLYASGTAILASPTASNCPNATLSNVTIATANSITATLTTGAGPLTNVVCDVYVLNSGAGDNGAGFDLAGAVGFGTAPSTVAPVITASSLTTAAALNAGDPSSTIVLTGSGFGAANGVTATIAPDGATTTAATLSGCVANGTGTTLTCSLTPGDTGLKTGIAGSFTVSVNGGTLANAFTVAGPAITSLAPSALAIGVPVGTAVAITGTGFSNTTTGTVTPGTPNSNLAGVFQYVSPTSENFVVTGSPTAATAAATPATLTVKSVNANGFTVSSQPGNLAIDGLPSVTSLKYSTAGTSGVGVGATAQGITIGGAGFQAGATVGSFVTAAGVADANVKATVTAVTASQITATIAVAAGDKNTIVGYTVTNPDGGAAKISAIAPLGLTIDAAPTITAVTPTPVLASATNAITITGTGFAAGAVVNATSNATCGTTTVVSATSITVSCTFGVAQTTGTSLVVTNVDGGSATSAVVLPASSGPKPPAAFRVIGAHGYAVPGRTVHMTISGTGFYGQPRITSSAAGTRVGVSKDSGHVLVLRVTTKAGTRHGKYTFTIRLANGKTGRANYSVR
ncbi:MAG: beta strand repeat-containing protein [Acidimicrobiales bacterium]